MQAEKLARKPDFVFIRLLSSVFDVPVDLDNFHTLILYMYNHVRTSAQGPANEITSGIRLFDVDLLANSIIEKTNPTTDNVTPISPPTNINMNSMNEVAKYPSPMNALSAGISSSSGCIASSTRTVHAVKMQIANEKDPTIQRALDGRFG